MPDRKYGQDEIQRILKKAAEKQQRASEVTRPVVGLSIEEIERIAAEAGINPRFVREAAWESKTLDDSRKRSRWLGGITSMKVARSIPAMVPDAELDTELIPVIREQANKIGHFEKLGKTLTWTDNESFSKVKVTSKEGMTDIAVETTKSFRQNAYAVFIIPALMILFLIAGISKNGLDTPSMIFALIFFFSAIAARWGYATYARKIEHRLENITNALEDKVLEIGTVSQNAQQDDALQESASGIIPPLMDLDSDQADDLKVSQRIESSRNRDSA